MLNHFEYIEKKIAVFADDLNGEDSESDKSSSLTDSSSLKNGHIKHGNFIPKQNGDRENKHQEPKVFSFIGFFFLYILYKLNQSV